MNKNFIKALLLISVIILSLIIYRIIVKNISLTERIIYLLIIFALGIISLVFRKELLNEYEKISFDKSISFLSIVIALIVFIDTSIQSENNNTQFKKNRIASDSLFKVQLIHAQKLNELLMLNSNNLNDSLVIELNKIQDINISLTKSADNQLKASVEQLKLSKQSLEDYIIETRANLILNKINISNLDTLDNGKLKLVINNIISNTGKRKASNFEFRDGVIFNDNRIEISLNNSLNLILPSEPKKVFTAITISGEEYKDFFYWRQIIYYDERLDKLTDRSNYYHYYKSLRGYDFYYVSPEQKVVLRRIIDNELKIKRLSLTAD